MAQFKYTRAIPSAFTLSDGKDYHLFEGNTYELPESNAHIASLVEQGFLVAETSVKPLKQSDNKIETKK